MLDSSGHWAYQPLSAEHVRWYWLKPNFDAKTAVKSVQPDVPHRADILRFCDADNAVLEAGYQCVCCLPQGPRQAQQLTHAVKNSLLAALGPSSPALHVGHCVTGRFQPFRL